MMREFEIERQFDIKIETIKPNKGVYYLKTNKGERCLKKISYGPQKLLFVYGAKEHLNKSGYDRVDKYFLNINGEPFALVNEDLYTLSEWIDGRECDFNNKEEVTKAAKNLAEMHLASRGYEPPENSKLKSDLDRWPHLIDKRSKALEKMNDMARKKRDKTEFDMIYMKALNFYKDLCKRAKNTLNTSEYDNICRESEELKIFCHHDYTYHNIIIDKNDEYNIIDFDYCKREIRVYDISNFMIKVLKRNNWDIEFAKGIIEGYNSIWPLEKREYRVLLSFLIFPQRFWRLANRYYYNEVTWGVNTFIKKINEIIEEKDEYLNFIEKFKEEYKEEE